MTHSAMMKIRSLRTKTLPLCTKLMHPRSYPAALATFPSLKTSSSSKSKCSNPVRKRRCQNIWSRIIRLKRGSHVATICPSWLNGVSGRPLRPSWRLLISCIWSIASSKRKRWPKKWRHNRRRVLEIKAIRRLANGSISHLERLRSNHKPIMRRGNERAEGLSRLKRMQQVRAILMFNFSASLRILSTWTCIRTRICSVTMCPKLSWIALTRYPTTTPSPPTSRSARAALQPRPAADSNSAQKSEVPPSKSNLWIYLPATRRTP